MLATAIERRFDGARCVAEGSVVRAEIPIDGTLYRARVAMAPIGRVAVQVPHTDGFDLALAWTDRSTANVRPPTFDDSYLVETNDVALASAWLDLEARSALLASRYASAPGSPSPRATLVLLRDGTWIHELRGGEVIARRLEAEPSRERIADMLAASLAIASRPSRWAKWFAKLARAVGGHAGTRVELGGKPVLRVRRGAIDVSVRLLRRLDPDEPGRLRTLIGARRIGSAGDTLTLISDRLPRTAWPPPNARDAPRLRIESEASNLLDAARPATSIVRPHDVEITFDGAVADANRLGAAIELAARWASDTNPSGPYR